MEKGEQHTTDRSDGRKLSASRPSDGADPTIEEENAAILEHQMHDNCLAARAIDLNELKT
ncbi:hypothetical protein F511_39471 [Dorcoceras hygrometricum]|uniref:Uncharacterized protein n=1 Tax=Dorcoceras hygrometricum TaxID=472368 RepID=A0A2Z7CUB4_9LAMI|nr:hypothetical protein F511_39471 [Dorcoceras hygrometricum]